MQKYVVIGLGKKLPGGSRVFCAGQSKEKCEELIPKLEAASHLAGCGPYKIITIEEAEKKKMYGD